MISALESYITTSMQDAYVMVSAKRIEARDG